MVNTADEGFQNYEITTTDPGGGLLIATLIFCVLTIGSLPFFVHLGKRCQKLEEHDTESEDDPNHGTKNQPKEALSKQSAQSPSSGSPTNNIGDMYHKRTDDSENGDDDDDDDARSVHSNLSTFSGAAKGFIEAILSTTPHGGTYKSPKQVHVQNREERIEQDDQKRDVDQRSIASHSVLGKLSQDEVSIRDAVDAKEYDNTKPPENFKDRLCNFWDGILMVAEWDYESKRICKLGGPFIIQALVEGISEAVRVAIIGHFIGTRALSAYVVVDLMIGLTTGFLGGFQDALTTVCSQAVGVGNRTLAGQYIQIATIVYTVLYIPIFLFWMLFIGDTMTWLGFDENTREIAEDFAMLFMFAEFLEGIDNSSHSLLDVIGRENYSTVFSFLQEVTGVALTAVVAIKSDTRTLQWVGLVMIAESAIGLIVNTMIIVWNGWFDRFLGGLVGSCAVLNTKATRLLLSTSIALSLGELLAYGEWEILTIFASYLGPAEVAAWGLLGTIWDALELVTEAVADAAEVRTAFLLGSGQPEKAKISSYKSMFLGMFASLMISSFLFIGGEDVPTWLTTDPMLQRLTAELLPLFGIGNIALTIGTISWTLVGSQGRYRLATAVGFSGVWFISLPLAAVFSIALGLNLKGQTAAVVIGYMVSGSINTYIVFQSDWNKLSRRVIEQTQRANEGAPDDASSSSSSSSSDSDSDDDDEDDEVPTTGGNASSNQEPKTAEEILKDMSKSRN